MDILYANGGFYPLVDRALYQAAGTWPKAGVEISYAERDALLEGERAGKIIVADASGKPALEDPTAEMLVPRSVSPAQGRVALIRAGKLQAVIAEIDALGDEAKAAFEFATAWSIDSPLLNTVAATLDLDLKQLFTAAADIKL